MKAVIMAGGKGTRLRPLTCGLPKPMVPVVNRPMMEHVVDLLVAHGYTDIACTLFYKPEMIQNHFLDGSQWGCSIRYSIEDTPLGTAGSVKALSSFLDSTFIVISGDALTDLDLTQAVDFHRRKGAAATLVLTRVDTPLEYGVVIIDSEGRIVRFLEKPSWGEVFSDTVNTGIYVLEPEVLDLFDHGQEFDFSKNLFPMLLERGYPMFGHISDGYWCDVGNLEQYRQTHIDILAGKARVKPAGTEVTPGVWIGDECEIDDGAVLLGRVVIGDGVRVMKGGVVDEYTAIGPHSIVREDASVRRSVVWSNVYIGRECEIRGAIIADRTSIKPAAGVYEGAVIGERCSIGERAQVKAGVKIWPEKVVEGSTQVNTSLVWGTQWSKRLFGARGVIGLTNVELTPEFASRIAAAYGSCLPGESSVAVSSDPHPASLMIKSAAAAGLLSSGARVLDLGRATPAVMRYSVPALGAAGGLHIMASPYDLTMTLIEFSEARGIGLSKAMERKIENAFLTEDFRRASHDRIEEAHSVEGMFEKYTEALISTVDALSIRRKGFKIALEYDRTTLGHIVLPILERLGCSVVGPFDLVKGGAGLVEGIQATSRAVSAGQLDLGAVLDSDGGRLLLMDETGNTLSDEDFMALVCLMEFKQGRGRTVVMPVTAPLSVDAIARRMHGRIAWTKSDARSVMERAIEEKIHIGEGDLPHFHPVFDGIFTLVKLLELCVDAPLSKQLALVPKAYVARQVVQCPWSTKGTVMRTLIEETNSEQVQLIDGIKVYHDHGWTLILPDSEQPSFHVYSEAMTEEIAEAISEIYVNRIQQISQGGESEKHA